MTSNDRHASHDSPYRTGQHVPLNQNRHAPLTSVATSAIESRPDLGTSYDESSAKGPSISANPLASSDGRTASAPYSPGMRSKSATDIVSPGEIQMQSFADGAPPPPPPSHSWKKIDAWTEKNYEELHDQLGEGCTQNDINELEHELDCSLPQDVRDSIALHDGQERGGRPTGIIFGCMLMDCEEIVQEWKQWKKVNEDYLSGRAKPQAMYPIKTLNQPASSSSAQQAQHASNKLWRQELLEKQDSQPPNAIQKAYSHPSWIPLARDWGGNNIAVDLAPGPMGKWGQIIIFGRDYDCKYVIAKSWASFLATFADDLSSEKVMVDEESSELKLKEFKTENVEPSYMEILRWRADQKYGRRPPKRKPGQAPLGLNTNVSNRSSRDSPYNSPTVSSEDRGRSPQRFSRGPNASPRHQVGSPLARVHEEVVAPIPIRPGGDVVKDFATNPALRMAKPEKLIDAPTPTTTTEERKPFPPNVIRAVRPEKLVDVPTPASATAKDGLPAPASTEENKENANGMVTEEPETKGLGVEGLDGDMKIVQI